MTPEFLNAALVVFPAVIIGTVIGLGPCLVLTRWLDRRERRRWQQQEAESQRQFALQRQLWELEDRIREERLSDEEREWRRHYREEQAEVKREARRRLGLPEEERPR